MPFGAFLCNSTYNDPRFRVILVVDFKLAALSSNWTTVPSARLSAFFCLITTAFDTVMRKQYIILQGRTVLLYARATNARRSPECVKKYARVAYVILCNSVGKVRYNECTHGDEKPPPPIRDGRVNRGKEKTYGGKERGQGRSPWWGSRGRNPRRGLGAEPPTG